MGKVEILKSKLENILDRTKSRNQAMLNAIERDNNMLSDYIVPLGEKSPLNFISNGNFRTEFLDREYKIHINARRQFADKFGIPQKYVNDLHQHQWGRDLLRDIFEEHKLHIPRERILLRTIGDETRAVLSDKYKRLNSTDIYGTFIKKSTEAGTVLYEANYTETKSYISTIFPDIYTVDTPNNGQVHCLFGARISNSDFGDGALELRAFQINVVCMNGMVSESVLKQIHLGKRLPDNINFSDRTYKLETEATVSAVEDVLNDVLSLDRMKESVMKIKEASAKLIDTEKEIIKLSRFGILKEEQEMIGKVLVNGREEDGVEGKGSLWKLTQAMTSVANNLDARRRQDINEIAGKMISF